MTGFTPINAPKRDTAMSHTKMGPSTMSRQRSTLIGSSAPRSEAASAVAEYLGRQPPPDLLEKDSTSAFGVKKVGGKGKKRPSAVAADSISKAKRRKTSDLRDQMATGKPSVSSYGIVDKVELEPRKKTASTARDKMNASTQPKTTKAQSQATPASATSERAVDDESPDSVFAPPTSMSNMSASTQQTSYEAAQSSRGHAITLYGAATSSQARPVSSSQHRLASRTNDCRRGRFGVAKASFADDQSAGSKRPIAQEPSQADQQSQLRKTSTETTESAAPFLDDDYEENLSRPVILSDDAPRDSPETSGSDLVELQQLPTPETSNDQGRNTTVPLVKDVSIHVELTDEIHWSDSDDDEIINLAKSIEMIVPERPENAPRRTRKQNMRDVDSDEDYARGLFSDAELKLLDKLESSRASTAQPLVRAPFPAPILNHSPLFGVSNNSVLRTCFRIGEAMAVGCQAVRANKNVLIELYARVTKSKRENHPGRKQSFVFKDLYHDKPPHLAGTFELLGRSQLWDLDSKAFLTIRPGGVLCRAIGRMKREECEWRMDILNIWEASWEDITAVAGVYVRPAA